MYIEIREHEQRSAGTQVHMYVGGPGMVETKPNHDVKMLQAERGKIFPRKTGVLQPYTQLATGVVGIVG
jgi:hypothetical protein